MSRISEFSAVLTAHPRIVMAVMLLTLLGREFPDLPCALLFDPCECEVLQLLAKKKEEINSPSEQP